MLIHLIWISVCGVRTNVISVKYLSLVEQVERVCTDPVYGRLMESRLLANHETKHACGIYWNI